MNWLNCKLDSTFTGSLIKRQNVGPRFIIFFVRQMMLCSRWLSLISTCIHACMYIYTHYKRYMLNAYIDLHIYILIHLIYTYISALYIWDVVKCILFNAHTLIAYIYIYIHIYTYIYICIYIYTYIYIYIYIYIYLIFIYNIIDMYMIAHIQMYHICLCIYTHILYCKYA